MKKKVLLIIGVLVIALIGYVFSGEYKGADDAYRSEIIKDFTENEDRFKNVKDFAMKLEDNLYVYVNDDIVKYDDEQKAEIEVSGIKDDIEYILLNLDFSGIYKDDEGTGNVDFVKAGSTNVTGLYYSETKGEENEASSFFERIKDHWFFYYQNPT